MTALIDDDLFESFESSIGKVEESESLPPLCYTNEDFYAFERKAIFYKEWLCAGRASWLRAPGDYFTLSHANEPIIVAMTKAGDIAAMSAVCQHRAMLVAEGHGNAPMGWMAGSSARRPWSAPAASIGVVSRYRDWRSRSGTALYS